MAYLKRTALLFVYTTLVATVFTGCDKHKQKRADLLKKKSDLVARIGTHQTKQVEITRSIDSLSADIKLKESNIQNSSVRKKKLQDELAAYVLDNKLATLSLMGTIGGAGAILKENLDSDTKVAIGIGIGLGLLYCYNNADECTGVTTRVIYYGGEIDKETKNISGLSSEVSTQKGTLERLKQDSSKIGSEIVQMTRESDTAQQEHDSLTCTWCI
jgi:chromosome segregation ATPase